MKTLLRLTMAGVIALAGCSGSNGTMPTPPNGGSGGSSGLHPSVVQTGHLPVNWTQFTDPPTGFGNGYAIVAGFDKNIWTTNNQGGLMQIKMTGAMHLYPMSYVCNGVNTCNFVGSYGMAVGSDHRFYIGGTNYDYNASRYVVGAATTAAALTAYDIPSGDYAGSGGFTLGPDNKVWFTEQKHVANITTSGTVSEYSYPSGATSNSYGSVTTGPDGNIWFTEYNNEIVGKIVPATHAITEYSVAALSCNPTSIVTGPDHNLYFSCSNYLGQITTAGVATKFYNAYNISYLPQALQIGPDGNVWFADNDGAYIGEFNPSNISFTEYIPPYSGGTVYDLALGPDGNFWSPESDNKINVYIVKTLGVSPASLTFTATGQTGTLTVTEPGTTHWTASSISSGVCSVVQGSPANKFTVTANGIGTTKVTIKDAIGNSFAVTCKVT